jgi:hypothetical protein
MADITREDRLRQLDAQDVEIETDVARRKDLNPDAEPGADAGDVSPHHGRQAQPGDVLGLETGGETTELGDTPEDEDERRRRSTEK